jgi:hypothetical protein
MAAIGMEDQPEDEAFTVESSGEMMRISVDGLNCCEIIEQIFS